METFYNEESLIFYTIQPPGVVFSGVLVCIRTFSKRFTPDFSTENMVLFKEVQPRNEFHRIVIFSTIRLKGAVNFFIRQFLEIFYFPSAFIAVIESL